MIRVCAVLAEADINAGGYITTEGACLSMVDRFKKDSSTILIKLGPSPSSPIIGKLIDMEYNKEKKIVVGTIELNLNFNAGGVVYQKLETPDGTRILDCSVKQIIVVPGGSNE
jgi:hypothetical protein